MSAGYILHDLDVSGVKLVNGPFGRDAHSADEKGRLVFYDNIDELRKLTTSVVVLKDIVQLTTPSN